MAEKTGELAVFLPGNRTAFEPGARLDVAVMWAFDRPPGPLDVRLFWITRGKGTEDIEIVANTPLRADVAAGEGTCTFTLPEAPWSFSGKLISLVWGVEAVATTSGRAASCEFVLAPGAAEIRLHEPAAGVDLDSAGGPGRRSH